MNLSLVDGGEPAPEELKLISLRNRRFKLAELICLTEEMLKLAQAEDWNGLEAMEKQRQTEFEVWHAMATWPADNEEEDPLVAEALATLLTLNDQIKDRVQSAREEVLKSRQQHQSGKQAVTSYTDHN